MKFLFWNIYKKPLQNLVGELANEQNIDVVILAENEIDDLPFLQSLNKGRSRNKFSPSIHYTKRGITIFTNFMRSWLRPVRDTHRISISELDHPLFEKILLVAVHLPSKLYGSHTDSFINAIELREEIETIENIMGHKRTILVGDMNMNPFEEGMVAAKAIHGVMDKRIAYKKQRKVNGKLHPFFYNPMWKFLGDETEGPPGTYHYDAGQISYFWNTFDQVLIRPDLIKGFIVSDLKIITQIGNQSLLRENGVPNKTLASDHLPIVFKINLNMRG